MSAVDPFNTGNESARATVILTMLLSFITFWLAGSKAQRATANGLRRLSGKPVVATGANTGPQMTVPVATGWAVLFLFLIIGTDIPPAASLSAAFGVLILISIMLAYGPDAFDNVSTVLGQPRKTAPVADASIGR